MVPLDVLNDLRKFLKFKMQSYSGLTVDGKAINCFTGFLPRAMSPEVKERLCPAIVVGYSGVMDRADESIVSVVISVVTRDSDMIHGADELFHVLEYIRHCLLSNNPVCGKYDVKTARWKRRYRMSNRIRNGGAGLILRSTSRSRITLTRFC